MNFDIIAKDLLKPAPKLNNGNNPLEKANALLELAENGFGRAEIFSEIRQLYDSTEDDSIKKQLLDMVVKVHGLYKDEDKKETPKIIFNIVGASNRVKDMLSPPLTSLNPASESVA